MNVKDITGSVVGLGAVGPITGTLATIEPFKGKALVLFIIGCVLAALVIWGFFYSKK